MGTFLTALSALHGDTVHVARFDSQLWQLGKGGGGMCRRVGPTEVQSFRKFQTKSAPTLECVLSPGVKYKFSTKLPTNLVNMY
jgi:hypothetical protein